MKIGIIVHSQTGHTLSAAMKLRENLLASGHEASVDRVTASNDSEQNADAIVLTGIPKLDGYDMLVLGAPVRGFGLSPVMQAYLGRIPSFNGQIISGFVTQFFPSPSMGGKQAITSLADICRSKGAELSTTAIINWLLPGKRNKLIQEMVDKFTNTASNAAV